MRIFLDTNVILENFLAREDFPTAHSLFQALRGQKHELAMRTGCAMLLTFNKSDYPSERDAGVRVMTPQEYLEEMDKD